MIEGLLSQFLAMLAIWLVLNGGDVAWIVYCVSSFCIVPVSHSLQILEARQILTQEPKSTWFMLDGKATMS